MNIYIFKPIVVNLRDKYFDFKVFLKYRFRFLIGKFKTKFKYNLKSKASH